MTLETLQAAMIAAMKERNKARKDSISSLISAVKKAAIDKMCRDDISEELVNEVILKEKKTVLLLHQLTERIYQMSRPLFCVMKAVPQSVF